MTDLEENKMRGAKGCAAGGPTVLNTGAPGKKQEELTEVRCCGIDRKKQERGTGGPNPRGWGAGRSKCPLARGCLWQVAGTVRKCGSAAVQQCGLVLGNCTVPVLVVGGLCGLHGMCPVPSQSDQKKASPVSRCASAA